MGKTIVTFVDSATSDPQIGYCVQEFSVYNEAMSYAKNATVNYGYNTGERPLAFVWNLDGGSGYWDNANFTAQENNNYPS